MKTVSSELLSRSTCPNCWQTFEVEDVKWISAHEELLGDVRLGNDHQLRFRPTRFDVQGNAIDIKGISCQELACPHCHLKIPRSVLVFRPFFVSIAGTPSCGKSFLLASMIWQLRSALPSNFNVQFSDSDGECNRILNDYEDQLFFASGNDRFTKLAKTDVVGDWYSNVQYDDQSVAYPKPFYFDLRPNADHKNTDQARHFSRLLCVYDNAGESFLPGADTVASPVTRHLGLAESWMFCFDPTQDPRLRRALDYSTDHQILDGAVTSRQESVLNEMVNRIRKHGDLGMKERSDKPLIIVCTKFDAWFELLGDLPDPWTYSKKQNSCILNLTNIDEVSTKLKTVLQKFCPELVAASQSISNQVYFVPVSATGVSPTKDPDSDDYMIPTHQIDPIWCEVPLLISLAHRAPKLITGGRSNTKRQRQT